jgi:hypothetical protein
MRLRTLFFYLIGSRAAIRTIAADRQALWIGLLFVLSAGFSREYDGEDLLHEPWYALIPVGASLASSFVLYTATYGIFSWKHASGPGFLPGYRSFLGLFWMTAPLAWLYAIPYERFLSPLEATRANLWTLAVVSVWRVFLMMRVVGTLMGYGGRAVFLVMAFADAVMLTVLKFVPFPIFEIMGGVRLSPEESLIRNAACFVCFWGTVTLPVWGIGTLVIWGTTLSRGLKPDWPAFDDEPKPGSAGVLAFALAAVLVWFAILPFTQPEQILRRRVEQDMERGEIGAGLHLMSAHEPSDFPPHWDAPPRARYGQNEILLFDILDTIAVEPPAPWVRDVYLQKFEDWLFAPPRRYWVRQRDATQLRRAAVLLRQLPEGPALLGKMREAAAKKDGRSDYVARYLGQLEEIFSEKD